MNKYKNRQVEYMGIKFDSHMEMEYYKHLLNYYPAEAIKLQPVFELQPQGLDYHGDKIRPITYIADFQIYDKVIDVKGFCTPEFILKCKMFKYKYPTKDLILIKKAPKWYKSEWIELGEYNRLIKQRKKGK